MPGIEHAISISGVSPLDNNATLSNAGLVYFTLTDWSVRGKGQDFAQSTEAEHRMARFRE